MSTKNRTPTIEAIIEDPEDGSKEELKGSGEDSYCETAPPSHQRSHEPSMRANMGRGRSKKAGKQAQKAKAKNISAKKGSLASPRDFEEPPQVSHQKDVSNGNEDSSSSDEEGEEHVEDPRTALARARLTSPSIVSTMTTHTTATNKSSSSSGSNSTVTKSSVATKRSGLGKRVEMEDAPMSPACPDPPSACSFIDDLPLQQEADSDEEEEEHYQEERQHQQQERHHQEERHHKGIRWPKPRALMETAHEEPASGSKPQRLSTSSSASSSLHGDDTFSEQPAENGSDRSTSPEWSDRGHEELNHGTDQPPDQPTDQHSAKIASQIAAARQRQGSLTSMQQFGTPEMPRGNMQLPHIPASALNQRPNYQSAQYQPTQVTQRPLPRAEKLPITGYELLATKLASTSSTDVDEHRIKPMYRKFEALNHRLLLHLQDELVELEEQLHRLDHADTQSRRMDRHIIPASRRAAEQAGGELQWHKTDVLGRIGFKLAQYNQALSSFNSTQSLSPPSLDDIDDYRDYLYAEQPIAEAETHFLDPEEDLVTISRHGKRRRHPHRSNSFGSGSVNSSAVSSRASATPALSQPPSPSTVISPTAKPVKTPKVAHKATAKNTFFILAGAAALAILIPILTFLVVPALVGRVIITILVTLSVTTILLQSHLVNSKLLLSQEGGMCVGLYGGIMLVIAGIMA